MQVDGHVRIVFAQQPRHRPRFGRVELHVIAVQVVALSVRPLTHPSDRPVLTATIGEGHPFIAVRVVDGRDQQYHRLPPFAVAAGQEVAEQHLERLLPAHLAAVDVALQVDDRLAGSSDGRRTRICDVAHYGQWKRPSLVRVAVGGVVDRRRAGRRALQEVHDIGVGAGFVVVGALGAGEEGVVQGRGTVARREDGRGGRDRRACCRATQSRKSSLPGRHALAVPFQWSGLVTSTDPKLSGTTPVPPTDTQPRAAYPAPRAVAASAQQSCNATRRLQDRGSCCSCQ